MGSSSLQQGQICNCGIYTSRSKWVNYGEGRARSHLAKVEISLLQRTAMEIGRFACGDVRTQKQVGALQEETVRYGIYAVTFSPDGKWLASGALDGRILLWSMNLSETLALEPKGKRVITLGGLKRTMLLQNFPNPFNPETWIPYHLTEDASVAIQIYDAQGTPVRKLDLGQKSAGTYLAREAAAYWDGRNDYGELLSSGLYFYQLRAAEFSATRRMILAK